MSSGDFHIPADKKESEKTIYYLFIKNGWFLYVPPAVTLQNTVVALSYHLH